MNLEKLKQGLSKNQIIDLLQRLGSNLYADRGTELIFYTICHNTHMGDASPKLYYYLEDMRFVCYTECQQSWDVIGFVQQVFKTQGQDINFHDTIKYIVDSSGISPLELVSTPNTGYVSELERYEPKNKSYDFSPYDSGVLATFADFLSPEWESEGIDKDSMREFEISFSVGQNKIIIPHRDIKGNLIGIRGRAMNKDEIDAGFKYMPIKIGNILYTHPVSYNLYGINKISPVHTGGRFIVFEGEKSVLKSHSFYGENSTALAVCGSNFSAVQFHLLWKHFSPSEVVLALDKEFQTPYTEKSASRLDKLELMIKPFQQYCTFSAIHDVGGILREKDSPVDKGKEAYEHLLEERIFL